MLSKGIKVVGVDNIRTHTLDSEHQIYNVYFELSIVPPNEWKKIFEEQYSAKPQTSKKYVDGRHIVVQCLFSEIEENLQTLRKEATKTNQKYLEHIRKKSNKTMS